MIVSLPKCSQKLKKICRNGKPENANIYQTFYKLFSVVHNYFLGMFLIIERIYDDRIPPKCPQKLRKFADGKPENANIYQTIL